MQLYLNYGAPSYQNTEIYVMPFLPCWHSFFFFFKSAMCPLRSWVLQLTEASSLRPDSLRKSPQNETVKLSRCQMIVASHPMEWPWWTWCTYLWHSHIKSALFCIHSSVHSSGGIDIISFREFRVTALVFGCSPSGSTERHPPRRLTLKQLPNSSDTRRATQKDGNAKFWFGNIVPKQLTF